MATKIKPLFTYLILVPAMNTNKSVVDVDTVEKGKREGEEVKTERPGKRTIKEEDCTDQKAEEAQAEWSENRAIKEEDHTELKGEQVKTETPGERTIKEEDDTELILEWLYYADDDYERKGVPKSLSVDDMIANAIYILFSDAVSGCDEDLVGDDDEFGPSPGEFDERDYTIKLVSKTTKKEIAHACFSYWLGYVNLESFHAKSQDLADFCLDAWVSAGRRPELYSDFEVEMGESIYSEMLVNDLISEIPGATNRMGTAYIESGHSAGCTDKAGLRIFQGLAGIFGGDVALIVYKSDLDKLGIAPSDVPNLITLPKRWDSSPIPSVCHVWTPENRTIKEEDDTELKGEQVKTDTPGKQATKEEDDTELKGEFAKAERPGNRTIKEDDETELNYEQVKAERPCKQATNEEDDTELILEWLYYPDDDFKREGVPKSLSVADMITNEYCIWNSDAVGGGDDEFGPSPGEFDERDYTIKLVSKTTKEEIAHACFSYWLEEVSLESFHAKSQDLADFCLDAWISAGRRPELYSDFEVEMGESIYSEMLVNDLISEIRGAKNRMGTAYIESGHSPGCTDKAGFRIFQGLAAIFGGEVALIVYKSDLDKLGIAPSDVPNLITLPKVWNSSRTPSLCHVWTPPS